MIIAIDMDCTLCYVDKITERITKQLFNIKYKTEELTTWDYFFVKWPNKNWYEVFLSVWKFHWNEIKPTVSKPDIFFKELSKYGTIVFVTASNAEMSYYKMLWLEKYKLNNYPFIAVPLGNTKEQLGFDVYVDDRLETIMKVIEKGKIGIIYDKPWNRNVDTKSAFRIKSLKELPSLIEKSLMEC